MPRGASLTAEVVCLFRAIETLRPPGERVLDDPFARAFLRPSWQLWARSPLSRKRLPGWLDLGPGSLQTFVVGRHRFMDDALRAFLADGGEQVVVLGAGYDARALRFAELLAGRPFIEIDFPATQAKKRQLLAEALPGVKSPAIYLPLDFEHHTLAEALSSAPYDRTLRTFFVWEGVAMYLNPATVDQTLAMVAAHSRPGSELVCDLWSPPLGRDLKMTLRRAGERVLGAIGEPLRFAIQPSEVASFFAARGYHAADVVDSRTLAERYGLVERRIFPDNCVARAVVR